MSTSYRRAASPPAAAVQNAEGGFLVESVIFLFLLFRSRLTFSTRHDRRPARSPGLHNDPELRARLLLVRGVPCCCSSRAFPSAPRTWRWRRFCKRDTGALGGLFTSCPSSPRPGSSVHWDAARGLVGAGNAGADPAGAVACGRRRGDNRGWGETSSRLCALPQRPARDGAVTHPSSVVGAGTTRSRRMRRQGAFIAWMFFMLFALSLAGHGDAGLSLVGLEFEESIILAVISALSTTGGALSHGGSIGRSCFSVNWRPSWSPARR